MRKSLAAILCTASLLSVSGLAAGPAQAQRVVDVTPGVGSQSVSADALVSGVFDSSTGTVEVSSVRLFIDGQDVTEQSSITRNFFSYQPTQNLSPGQHQVQVEYSNAQGQRRVASWSFTVENPQPALAINSVTHNATEPLAQDATLLATVNGTPGAQATVLLIENGSVVRQVQAQEVSPGIYVASYSLSSGNVSAETIAVGQLQRGDSKIFAAATQPIVVTASTSAPEVIDTEVGAAADTTTPETTAVDAGSTLPLQPEFTSHSNGAEISSRGFTLVGRTQPNAQVQIRVDSTTAVAGGFLNIGGATSLVDTTVTADMNGEFSVQVPSPTVVNADTTYDVEAVARLGNQVSSTTRLMLEQL
ncbi:MAG: hypothetical protein AAFU71_18355 [Cyanobacteria bacterium J06632_22]